MCAQHNGIVSVGGHSPSIPGKPQHSLGGTLFLLWCGGDCRHSHLDCGTLSDIIA